MILLRLFLLATIYAYVYSSVPLVSPDGSLRMKGVQGSLEQKVDSGSPVRVLSVIDLTKKSCDNINKLMSTKFKQSELDNSICLDITDKSYAILATSYEEMYSSKFCGAKAADFCSMLSNVICIVIPGDELEEYVMGNDQTLRRIANKAKDDSNLSKIVFIVDSTGSVARISGEIDNDIINDKMGSIFSDTGVDVPMEIVTLNAKDGSSITSVSSTLQSSLDESTGISISDLTQSIQSKWESLGQGLPSALLSLEEKKSVYKIEMAYQVALRECDAAFAQWQSRVSSGKVAAKFGERVSALLKSVDDRFMGSTANSIVLRLRGQRRKQIMDMIQMNVETLFKQQVSIIQSEISNKFRKSLMKLVTPDSAAALNENNPKLVDNGEEQQAIRQSLFDFRNKVMELEVESLGISSESSQAEFSTNLETLAKEFPESPHGRLEAVKKVEKLAKKPQKKKGVGKGKSVNIGLNLVGMLRPPGYGNLQGFVGYATSMLGLPLDLLLGVQNDGDSPEIMGEDREYPILRIQPKMQFDIDL